MSTRRVLTTPALASLVLGLALVASAKEDDGLPSLTDSQVASYKGLSHDASTAYDAKQWRRSATLFRRAAAVHGENAGLWYNLACVEAMRGQTALALDALDHARDAGWADAKWPAQDSDLDSLHETTEFVKWVASVEEAAKMEPTWPSVDAATLAADEDAIAARAEDWDTAIARLSGVLGGPQLTAARRRLAAWKAASWDRVAASRDTGAERAAARLSAVHAIAGKDAMRVSEVGAAEIARRAAELIVAHPTSPLVPEARMLAAQAKYVLAPKDGADAGKAASAALERDLLLLAASLDEKAPSLPATLVALMRVEEDTETQRSLYGRFTASVPDAAARRKLMLSDYSTTGVFWLVEGMPEFEAKTLDGRTVTRDGLRGRVTLLDFWATWCGPCRAELPNVKKAHAEYHEKGFDVLGISLDNTKDKSTAAFVAWCKENEMPWSQVYDGKGWKTPLAEQFGVTGIPFPLLVDRHGRIVAAGGQCRGEELLSRVKALVEAPSADTAVAMAGQ